MGNEKKGGNGAWEWKTALKSTATYHDAAVTLFIIYRALITGAAIFAQRISHNSILTSHYSQRLTSLRVHGGGETSHPVLELQLMAIICHIVCHNLKVFKGGNN